MIEFSLTLRWSEANCHSTAAWFIPGADARIWLDEIARWEIPLSGVRMFPVPASIRDRKIIGVLVETGPAKPVAVLRGQPYGRVAGRTYLPVDSNLYPPVTDAELTTALPMAAYVFHPVAGLVGFAADEALNVDRLLRLAPTIRNDWSRARRAKSLPDRLVSVSAPPMPSVEELLQAHRGDIGSQAPDHLPPSSDESIAKKAGIALLLPPLGLIALLGLPPAMLAEWIGRARKKRKTSQPRKAGARSKSAKPASVQKAKPKTNWMSGFQQWTAAAYSVLSKSLLDARSRELRRLQELLRNNPDEGLRYAIPLHGQGSRGIARPGWRLMPRDLGFNFARMLSGGHAADPWAIADDTRLALLRQYREAANRELALGRFDRAAYIFANLLGDFGSAANAMEQGKRYREAAVIYREKLKNSRKAAECLEHGGLLLEAAELFESEMMFEKAGDLYQIVGQSEQAMRCYRTQVDHLFKQGKTLAAAALLENKLHEPDAALELLDGAWPRNDSAGLCLRESFALRGRLARHDQAVHRVKALRDSHSAVSQAATLASVLADVSLSYPQLEVRARSADATRVVAGRQLMKDHVEDRAAIARAVSKLAPGDRLLKRDVRRYVDEPRKRPAPGQKYASDSPRVLRQFELARDISWQTASASDEFFFALGNQKGRVYVVYGTWDGRHIGAFFETLDELKPGEAYRLHPEPGRRRVVITPLIHQNLAILMPSDRFGQAMEFGAPPWLRCDDVQTIAQSARVTWVLRGQDAPVLSSHESDTGRLLGSEAIGQPLPNHSIQMAVQTEHLLMTWGCGFCRRGPISGMRFESLPSLARQVEVTAPGQRYRAAIAMEEGIEICRENSHLHSAFALVEPRIAFSRGGHLIAADRTSGQVFHFEDEKLSRVVRFEVNGEQTIALTPTSHLDEFARFTADGKVTVYKIPR